ncbi:alpha/beta hydrolase fold domain-containing protein [Ramlibacter terrae]|uniref:Alpha/beta hydrolase fold domain-containing protein n=1 Tax=Ramlibacter terrae TaxID=2732511 RepID=A0ABX6P195_9BURK|nr:alpha/beta hydrolase fold domain-containing protein [Ramlibacter terrae]
MPHPDTDNWRSVITGKKGTYQPLGSVAELTQRRTGGGGLYAHLNVDLPELAQWHKRVVMRPDGRSTPTAEIYVPHGEGPFPVLVHIHGGAFFTGSAEGERKLAMRFAAAGFVVVNIDYALSPEQPFPRHWKTACMPRAGPAARRRIQRRPRAHRHRRRLGRRQSLRLHGAGAARVRRRPGRRRPRGRAGEVLRRGARLRAARHAAVGVRAAVLGGRVRDLRPRTSAPTSPRACAIRW